MRISIPGKEELHKRHPQAKLKRQRNTEKIF